MSGRSYISPLIVKFLSAYVTLYIYDERKEIYVRLYVLYDTGQGQAMLSM